MDRETKMAGRDFRARFKIIRFIISLCVLFLVSVLANFINPLFAASPKNDHQGLIRLAHVFYPDDRRVIDDNDRSPENKSMKSVGLVKCKDAKPNRVITAVMVNGEGDRSIIITTAHTFRDKHGDSYGRCYFYPGGPNGRKVRIVRERVGSENPYHDWNNDWAVGVLEKNIANKYGANAYGVIRPRKELSEYIRRGAKFFLAGYSSKHGEIRISDNCSVFINDGTGYVKYSKEKRILHNCDLVGGWSGGPLIMIWEHKYYVIGVQSAQIGIPKNHKENKNEVKKDIDSREYPNIAVLVGGEFEKAINRLSQ